MPIYWKTLDPVSYGRRITPEDVLLWRRKSLREQLAESQNPRAFAVIAAAGHFAGSAGALRGYRGGGRQYPHTRRVDHSLRRHRAGISPESGGDADRASSHGTHAITADYSLRSPGRMDLAHPSRARVDPASDGTAVARRRPRDNRAPGRNSACGTGLDLGRSVRRLFHPQITDACLRPRLCTIEVAAASPENRDQASASHPCSQRSRSICKVAW